MANAARAPKIIEMPLKRHAEHSESFVPASLPSESPAAIAARKLEALAHFHLAVEEYQEALDAFRRLLKLVPTRPDLLVQTVACMEKLELWNDGADLLQPEVDAHPDWTEAALALGICRLHLNQAGDALAVFQAVEGRSPGNSVAKEGIRAAQALLGPSSDTLGRDDAAKTANWEIELYELSAGREWERVLKACEPMVASGEPSAYFYAAHAMDQTGNAALARASYEQCLEANPSHREARYNLACLLIRNEHFPEAAAHLEILTSIDSYNWPAWWNFMLALERSAQHERAIKALQHLIQMEGYTPELRFRLAYNCLESGRLEEAARQFELCGEEDPDWMEAKINLGLAWGRMGKTERAKAIFEAALRDQPLNAEASRALVELYLHSGESVQAVSLYESLAGRGAAPAELSYAIGRHYEKQGDTQAARRYYQKALRSDIACTEALLALAELFGREGQDERRRRCHELALQLDESVAVEYFAGAFPEGNGSVKDAE